MTGWTATVLIMLALALPGPVAAMLARARWPAGCPRAGVVLWQAVLFAGTLAAIGAGVVIAVLPLAATFPHGVHTLARQIGAGDPWRGLGPAQLAALAWAVGLTGWLVTRCGQIHRHVAAARRRQRLLIDLVAQTRPDLPGWQVLPHPAPLAYCLPGKRPRIVTTDGAVSLLARSELDAVLAHERAHARARHHLVLLPFAAVVAAFPRLAVARRGYAAVARLVELLADDAAVSEHDRTALARALVRLGQHAEPAPLVRLNAAEQTVAERIERLLRPGSRPGRRFTALIYAGAITLVAGPAAALLLPVLPFVP